jgi:hypothetical protein
LLPGFLLVVNPTVMISHCLFSLLSLSPQPSGGFQMCCESRPGAFTFYQFILEARLLLLLFPLFLSFISIILLSQIIPSFFLPPLASTISCTTWCFEICIHCGMANSS